MGFNAKVEPRRNHKLKNRRCLALLCFLEFQLCWAESYVLESKRRPFQKAQSIRATYESTLFTHLGVCHYVRHYIRRSTTYPTSIPYVTRPCQFQLNLRITYVSNRPEPSCEDTTAQYVRMVQIRSINKTIFT
jgi:hypothetical protein